MPDIHPNALPDISDLGGTIADANVSNSAAIAWSKISKTSSSLADLATRTTANLSDFPSVSGENGNYLTTDGTALLWSAAPSGGGSTTEDTKTADYTLAATDAGKVIGGNSSSLISITIPDNATVAIPTDTLIEVYRHGTGNVKLLRAAGVSLLRPISGDGSARIANQYGAVRLRKRGTDEWVIQGDWAKSISANAGYAAGGITTVGVDTVDKFAFPSDTRSTLGTGLSSARYGRRWFCESRSCRLCRWWNHGANVDTVDKFAFPSDTRSTLGTGLSSARYGPAGFANPEVAGYAAGGYTSANVATVDKFAFPSDTRSTLGTGLSSASDATPLVLRIQKLPVMPLAATQPQA